MVIWRAGMELKGIGTAGAAGANQRRANLGFANSRVDHERPVSAYARGFPAARRRAVAVYRHALRQPRGTRRTDTLSTIASRVAQNSAESAACHIRTLGRACAYGDDFAEASDAV